ncbi:MAG: MATE family efflux transporter [Burkholderiaceae bacterium]|jgi:putative MATE family efflux protein|nr:MATE family efflux transporter [Burkholderiales bacterium]MCZ8339859.1 MATE family efflux transporter [Burkholderiaceae bacterium]
MSLVTGPILPTLLRLSAPNVVAMTMSVLVGIAETRYVGLLGTAPLAAMAIVFPFAMLVQMMSAGAMGGGVSSAVARALGAKDPARARTLALHAVVIGTVAGLATTVVFLVFGPAVYHALGGRGEVLEEAVRYSAVLFWGAVAIWLVNTLASILRGTGDMRVPSLVLLAVSVLQILVGGALGLGFGPIPRLGMPGVAIGQLVAFGAGTVFLLWWLASGRARIRLGWRGVALRGELFADILKVGALACLSPVQSVLTVLIFTALVARVGVDALAGYGIGQRLEFLLIPIAFGIGVASVPMVGMAIGAGDVARARRVAWTAASVSAVMLGALGAVVSVAPDLWARLFTQDEAVLVHARSYLRWAGPAFAAFGFGLTLYFASQGSGKVLGPVLAATLRLAVVAIAGAWLGAHGAPAWQYFALVAVAMVVYGAGTAASVRLTRWEARGGPAPAVPTSPFRPAPAAAEPAKPIAP